MKITINTQKASKEETKKLNEYLLKGDWDFKIDEEQEEEPKYILSEYGILIVGSHGITLNEKIHQEELHEYSIIEREELINNLIDWISECGQNRSSDKVLMTDDLKMLMNWEDTYIFTSNSTNSYIRQGDSNFNETCEELIALNETL